MRKEKSATLLCFVNEGPQGLFRRDVSVLMATLAMAVTIAAG